MSWIAGYHIPSAVLPPQRAMIVAELAMNDIRTRELEALRAVIQHQAATLVSRYRLIMLLAALTLFEFVTIIALVLEASAVICFALGAVVGVVVTITCWWAYIRWG
jgi:hypothetical protein